MICEQDFRGSLADEEIQVYSGRLEQFGRLLEKPLEVRIWRDLQLLRPSTVASGGDDDDRALIKYHLTIQLQVGADYIMAELEQARESIAANLGELEALVGRSGLFLSDPAKWRTQVTALSKEIKKQILLLEEEVKELPASQAAHYVGPLKSFRKKLEKLEGEAGKRERGDSTIPERSGLMQTAEQRRLNAIQQVMQRGDNAQAETKNSLREMNQMVERGAQMAADINIELTKQIEQLDRMADRVKDTDSVLKKAQKNITYFARAMECDMCMAGLLVLILLCLVAVIVLAVKKNSS